jgi:peptidyl-prolyl cis-trans isomerase D
MLEVMRKHSQSFLIYLLFGIIIAVFVVQFGPGNSGFSGADMNFAARVEGETISAEELRRAYAERVRFFQAQNPKGFDAKFLKQLGIKRQVLDELIELRLLKLAAEKNGLKVSSSELRDIILKEPVFQTKGKFDFQAYERYVNYNVGTSAARFEEDLAGKLLAGKMRDAFETSVSVSDAELKADYMISEDKVDLAFAVLKDSDVDATAPSAAEVAAFVKDHGADVEARYNRDITKYNEPKKWKARHILAKVKEGASADETKKAEEKIEAAEKELAAGKDFAEVAKTKSEDSTATKGGDLGWFGPGMMVKAFEDAADALKPGEVSKRVRSPFGIHLIKLEEVKEAHNRSLDTVRDEIAKQLIVEKKKDELLQAKANKLLADLKAGKHLKDLATLEEDAAFGEEPKKDGKKLTYKTTGAFNKSTGAIPKIGANEELLNAAFALTAEKPVADKAFKIGDRYYVVELKERLKPDETTYAQKREELRTTALNRRRSEMVRTLVKQLREKASVEVNDRLLNTEDQG